MWGNCFLCIDKSVKITCIDYMIRITKNMLDDSAKVLSGAFGDDPLFKFFFPGDSTRCNLAFFTFRFIAAHACSKGFVFAASPSFEGVSIWLHSQVLERGIIDQLRFGALKMYSNQGKEIIKRQVDASSYMKSIHAEILPGRHIYLSTIGIDKQHRGRGIASVLMAPGLEIADRGNMPCYLDTHNEQNLGLYRRYGFNVVHEGVIPGSNVRHWAMIRRSQR